MKRYNLDEEIADAVLNAGLRVRKTRKEEIVGKVYGCEIIVRPALLPTLTTEKEDHFNARRPNS